MGASRVNYGPQPLHGETDSMLNRSVFAQAAAALRSCPEKDLRLANRVWKVKFAGEGLDDCGGGYSESISEMCNELQTGALPLLIQSPNGRDNVGVNRDCFICNPSASSDYHMTVSRTSV